MLAPQMEEISVIIPAYNEEQAIGGVLARLRQVMDESGIGYEVIVVDDGSADATARIARQCDGVTVLQHRLNHGYGAALKTGMRHARHDLICITDADGTYPNECIPELARLLLAEEYDMIVGARVGKNVTIPRLRRPAKWAIGRLANYVAGEPIVDLNSGLRVFRRDAALRFTGILPDAFSFTTTITLAMLTNHYLVDYVPINYYKRVGKSKIRPVQDTLNFIQLVWRIALYFAPLKVFLPLSAFLFLVAIAWALFTLFVLGQLADVTTLVIVMTAFQVAVIGMLAELINKRLPNYFREER
jgi:glycosyltransferase involved in cell wall biosynthesis